MTAEDTAKKRDKLIRMRMAQHHELTEAAAAAVVDQDLAMLEQLKHAIKTKP